MKTIIVTGTPGTGKTQLARAIAKKLNFIYLDLSKFIKENKLNESYDKKRDCYIVNTKKLNKKLIEFIKTKNLNLVIDSHLSHYLPGKYVNLCIVTKCSLKTLKQRLKKRKYSENKIRENLDCEILDLILNEALEKKHNILVIESTRKIPFKKIKESVW